MSTYIESCGVCSVVGGKLAGDFVVKLLGLPAKGHRGALYDNKEGQLEIQLRKNPWKLVNIIDWNKAGTPLE